MSNHVNWANPYAGRNGRWLRGNLHTHTSPASACGKVPQDEVLRLYDEAGYDFLAISDHKTLTLASHRRMVLLPAIEWNSPIGEHTGVIGGDPRLLARLCKTQSHPGLLRRLRDTPALVILNHPNWQLQPHYRREQLLERRPYDGIEIYNGVIERLSGYAIATDKWDYLLANGRRVLGFASDDTHIPADLGLGWIMVRSQRRTAGAILDAIRAGCFYASSGVRILNVGRKDGKLFIETENGDEIRVIGTGGNLLHREFGRSLRYDVRKIESGYIRFEVHGRGAAMAWTQPFFFGDR